jgi:hypothetical protein
MTSFDVDHCVFAVDDGAEFRYVRRIRGEMLDEADERLPPLWKRIGRPRSPLVTAAQTGRPTFVPTASRWPTWPPTGTSAGSARWPRCRCAPRR